MKRKLLRLLPVAAVLLTASCIDDKYDLRDVDTTSSFKATDLIIPMKMESIKLNAIISVDKEDDVQIDDEGNFYFHKKGTNIEGKDYCFESDPIRVEKITIQRPADIKQEVVVEIALPADVQERWEQYAADKTIGTILGDASLMNQIKIDAETEIIRVNVNDKKDFNLSATGIDSRITKLDKLGIDPLPLKVDVKLEGLQKVVDKVPVENLTFGLPHGLTVTNVSDGGSYSEGTMTFPKLEINGQKTVEATVTGLNYAEMEKDGASFNLKTHTFIYNKESTVNGTATLKIGDLKSTATLADIRNAVKATYSCDVYFSDNLVVNKFSGGINYTADDDINIDPVVIDGLPEFLEQTGTSLDLENPQIYLVINNPFFSNGIQPTSKLTIIANSVFECELTGLDKPVNKLVLSPLKEDLLHEDYDYRQFDGLGQVLSGKDGIPDQLLIDVEKPKLKSDNVTDFELGKDLGPITGSWEFYAKLVLTEETKIHYETEWDDWGSDDLEGLTIEKVKVEFDVKKDVALDAEKLTFYLLGDSKEGKPVKREVWTPLSGVEKQHITLEINEPITNITGGGIDVTLKGQGKGIKRDQQIEISNLRMTVTGNYDKEF